MTSLNDATNLGFVTGIVFSAVTETIVTNKFSNQSIHRALIIGSASLLGGYIGYASGLRSNLNIILLSGCVAAFTTQSLSKQAVVISKDNV